MLRRQTPLKGLEMLLAALLTVFRLTDAYLLPNNHGHASTTGPSSVLFALSKREAEIRRKIAKLKKEGRIVGKGERTDEDDDDDEYAAKIRQKLGAGKSRLLGYTPETKEEEKVEKVDEDLPENFPTLSRLPQLGALPLPTEKADVVAPPRSTNDLTPGIDSTLFVNDDDDEPESNNDDDDDDDALVDLVAQRMREKRDREHREKEARLKAAARARLQVLEEDRLLAQKQQQQRQQQQQQQQLAMTTSGVGGSWSKNETNPTMDLYQPKSRSWGAFPRPRDISKAYGGGRRVGPGYSDEQSRQQSAEETRQRLQQYRERVGIDVQSEKDHAADIDEALRIATLAMQRGVYATAVSALEKVTKYCSTNSRVGGKVFLELAMAYEAMGRTGEAIAVYQALTTCRIEEIKGNAKRLLYGIEAMEFMKNEMHSEQFSRRRARNTFIDTTGMENFVTNFDDVYNTAYIDLNSGFYKKLTESVVRSAREARQIILRATGAGEVSRVRVVQALRSLSRKFDEALQSELEGNVVREPIAVMDGKPILSRRIEEMDKASVIVGAEEFVMKDAAQMMENLNGEWRLQLLADKKGDGVKYFNTTMAWQRIDTARRTFEALTPAGFVTVSQVGGVDFNDKRRVLRRRNVEQSGGVFANLLGKTVGAPGAVRAPQQVVMVDSVILVTRGVPSKRTRSADDEKDYFAVWRRVESGTFSRTSKR